MAYKDRETERAYQREWYQRNSDLYKAKAQRRRDENMERLLVYLLAHPCVDCGEADPVVLDFDHVGLKTATVTVLVRTGYAWSRVMDEIAQCEVVCANCHRRRTYARANAARNGVGRRG